ncbi:DUF4336 domain-containing protein [Endozoicomonas sp. SM1973]|uniref:DUF4336 domain-containing protein n=1 Tax=Spartinivicinus marinus TaxID=2994442 RepID=A0A853IB73_9GAMM|nr:DUF4336 domain-containing protein [Spartinivicinus marinus]MCX4028652.1 DUF4336 domain-containing protein [Spartinivicinus marinus]NYZ67081.1 DUF4336 domain-containing protein [Spartinivicinus marinus]
MLKQLAENLWTVESGMRFLGADIALRMTVVRLSDSKLVLISPVVLDEALVDALNQLGDIAYIVAPNLMHHLYAEQAKQHFPEAKLLVAPGLPDKRKDLAFDYVFDNHSFQPWQGELNHFVFTALPLLNEVVFFHSASNSLIVTDLVCNIQKADRSLFSLYLRLSGVLGKLAMSRLFRLLMRNKAHAREQLQQVLHWNFERIVMAHGEVIEQAGQQKLKEAVSWLHL